MPDGIIRIAIDVGTIMEAKRRVDAKRLLSNSADAMRNLRDTISDTAENIRRLIRDINRNEEESE
jgi:hypothetical protein